jgi:hypothetical protein
MSRRGCKRRSVGFLAAGVALFGACWEETQHGPVNDGVDAVEELTPDLGVSFDVPSFEVPPGTEVQDCYFFEFPDLNGDGSDVWIGRFKMAQRNGSHHMNVFRVNTVVNLAGGDGDVVYGGECRVGTNWADWPLVVNSQESAPGKNVVDWELPNGVAQRFHPGEMIMLQTHYVNAGTQETPDGGRVRVNFYRSQVPNPVEMGTLFATQQGIRICQDGPERQVFHGTCSFPQGDQVHVVAANGHFHQRGKQLDMFTWDGLSLDVPGDDQRFYRSLDWAEPPMTIGLDETVPLGGGVWWTCEYEWSEPPAGCNEVNDRDPQQADDCCYSFGGSVETSEHCNVFLYYWPKTDTDVFCN